MTPKENRLRAVGESQRGNDSKKHESLASLPRTNDHVGTAKAAPSSRTLISGQEGVGGLIHSVPNEFTTRSAGKLAVDRPSGLSYGGLLAAPRLTLCPNRPLSFKYRSGGFRYLGMARVGSILEIGLLSSVLSSRPILVNSNIERGALVWLRSYSRAFMRDSIHHFRGHAAMQQPV